MTRVLKRLVPPYLASLVGEHSALGLDQVAADAHLLHLRLGKASAATVIEDSAHCTRPGVRRRLMRQRSSVPPVRAITISPSTRPARGTTVASGAANRPNDAARKFTGWNVRSQKMAPRPIRPARRIHGAGNRHLAVGEVWALVEGELRGIGSVVHRQLKVRDRHRHLREVHGGGALLHQAASRSRPAGARPTRG